MLWLWVGGLAFVGIDFLRIWGSSYFSGLNSAVGGLARFFFSGERGGNC